MEEVFLEVVNVVAIGFEEVGFIDSCFLIVGAREVLALNACRGCGPGLRTVASFSNDPIRRHHISILGPTKAVKIRVGNCLKKLNSVFFFDGLLEALFQFFAIIVGKKLGARHRSCRDSPEEGGARPAGRRLLRFESGQDTTHRGPPNRVLRE